MTSLNLKIFFIRFIYKQKIINLFSNKQQELAAYRG